MRRVVFMELAARVPVRTVVEPYSLERANEALAALREGRLRGAAVHTTGFVSVSVAR